MSVKLATATETFSASATNSGHRRAPAPAVGGSRIPELDSRSTAQHPGPLGFSVATARSAAPPRRDPTPAAGSRPRSHVTGQGGAAGGAGRDPAAGIIQADSNMNSTVDCFRRFSGGFTPTTCRNITK